MRTYLDFEKPIADLEARLEETKRLAQSSHVDVSEAVTVLEQSIDKLRQEIFRNLTRWQRVQLSRHPDRPYTLDYISLMCDQFIELHGDRTVRDDPAMVGGFCELDGQTVMIIGQQKGRNTKQRQHRNFGMPNPEGYRKALRLMKLAEKFNKPIITLIDTPGAFPGLEAEERGQGEAIARKPEGNVYANGAGYLRCYWRRRIGWSAGNCHWRPGPYARKHVVFRYLARKLLDYSLAELGLKEQAPKQ
jgi:acetyl-CoA carboxylase carboxyl transferase subunit alpha